ncbi:hypothetical protein S1OALGB6SA_1320 [Olavius algarvensis spirochete endosymbiont]|uniref:hypothetical protein n=1 Tax=Olavius algarvensis spirochete endosymbiont TaxID=260710 RepID=UPI000F17E5DE|nr:hypothetical protein [Olavius algarvensis spirochete endosymbiont]VDB00245.1 hypothetical protein S1OALGB6SA_1320 [Olavius algarvensis spirochete endosymbiont]
MIKNELIKKSPLRKLDQSIRGGLSRGSIGVIASRKGIGKTACLVHIATDKLIAGQRVIHVSYAKRVDHIVDWYEDIFKEISQKRDLENAMEIHDEIIHNRVIMNFSQHGTSVAQVISGLSAMMNNGRMDAEVIVFDGYDFTRSDYQDVYAFKKFASDKEVELWFTDDYHRTDIDGPVLSDEGIPTNLIPFLDLIGVIITIKAERDYLHLYLVKDHERINIKDLPLKLDPRTLLIAEV